MGKRRKAIIIGAGIGGIAASIRLALLGFEVEVLEANEYPGGKLSEIQVGDFRFDAGPSLFTMPHFVEELFQLASQPVADFFQYQKMEVACRYFYGDGTELTAWGEENRFVSELAHKTGENPQNIIQYLKKSRQLFELTEHVFLKKSLHRLSTYLSWGTVQSALKLYQLDVFRTMDTANQSYFKSPKLVQFFDRYATYNGSNPYQAPATLNIIPHLEQGFGTFFPKGGMYAITQSLHQLAIVLGVDFHFGKKVSAILVEGNKANGVQIGTEKYPADLVVSNMDMVATYRKLLPDFSRPEWLLGQPKSSSALIFYWGIGKTFAQLDLHNIFFSHDYRSEFDAIFREKKDCA